MKHLLIVKAFDTYCLGFNPARVELCPVGSHCPLQVLSLGRHSSADVEGHEIVTMLTGCMELTVYLR